MKALVILFIAVTSIFSHAEASSFGARKVGIELEFMGVGEAADYTNMKNHQWLLERVKEQFGGGEISIKPWDKYANSAGTYCATMKDGLNRVWTIAPELMSPGIFDGYELITPPLNSMDDGPKLKRLLSSIEQSSVRKQAFKSNSFPSLGFPS